MKPRKKNAPSSQHFLPVEHRILDVANLQGGWLIDPSFFPNAVEYRAEVEHRMHAVMHSLHVKCAGKKIDKKVVEYPADWWQAFKARWFPVWAKARWPVVLTKVTMEANAFYPDIAIPDHQAFVEVTIFNG